MSEFYIEAKSLQRDSRIVRRGCCSLRTIRTPQFLFSAPPVSPFLVIFGHLWSPLGSPLVHFEDPNFEIRWRFEGWDDSRWFSRFRKPQGLKAQSTSCTAPAALAIWGLEELHDNKAIDQTATCAKWCRSSHWIWKRMKQCRKAGKDEKMKSDEIRWNKM